jgi:hypothetical protein
MKKTLMAGIAAATMMFAAAPAAAQVTFTGPTTGCFGAACAPGALAVNGGLTFNGGTFNQTTDNTGFLALGGTSDGLGTFTLTGLSDTYTGDIFRLLVSFSAPTGTTPGSTTYDTLLQGTVTGVNAGGVFVNFDNAVRNFASSAGPFTFALNDVSISSNSATQIISGQIQAAVPEPGTWAMMLLGFGGMGVALRRRRKLTSIAQLA